MHILFIYLFKVSRYIKQTKKHINKHNFSEIIVVSQKQMFKLMQQFLYTIVSTNIIIITCITLFQENTSPRRRSHSSKDAFIKPHLILGVKSSRICANRFRTTMSRKSAIISGKHLSVIN